MNETTEVLMLVRSNKKRAADALKSLDIIRDETSKMLEYQGIVEIMDICKVGINLGKIRKHLELIRDAKE